MRAVIRVCDSAVTIWAANVRQNRKPISAKPRQLQVECLERRNLLAGVTLITHGFGGNTDGWVSTMADAIETEAIKAVLGDRAREIVVGSTKSMTGHLLGAAGALEAIVSLMVCRTGKLPPTINYQGPDPECDLEYAHGGMIERPIGLALSNSFGFGGHNVCLAVRGWE